MNEYEDNDYMVVEPEEESPSFWKRVWSFRIIRKASVVFMMIITVSAVVYGIYCKIRYEEARATIESLQEQMLDLVRESEQNRVTNIIIEEKMKEIAELATASFEYSGLLSESNYREFFDTDVNIPFTRNKLEITYSGVIKVGYDVEQIHAKVDEESHTIYMTLPDAEVHDNYIIHDDMVFVQSNNPLNPISVDQVNGYLMEIEEAELARAEEQGIYELAERKIMHIIEAFFAEFPDYQIVFL